MTGADLAERMRTLATQRRPYVHATVVRAQEPTSARAGDAAIILDDGSIEGFVGGQCAESSVRTAALGTLRDGRTLLLRVLPDGAAEFPDSPGALVVVNPCHSGGAVEIFLKPMLPPPVVGLIGTTPISEAVAAVATFLDLVVDRAPAGDRWAGATAVVVASLGHGEESAIRAALDAGVGYIALVASRRRGTEVLDRMGLTDAERARVHSPAGLDIGARTPQEIALSILGDMIRAIRTAGLTAPSTALGPVSSGLRSAGSEATGATREDGTGEAPGPASAEPTQTSTDPICGMTVVIGPDTPRAGDHWFCCPGCRDRYLAGEGR